MKLIARFALTFFGIFAVSVAYGGALTEWLAKNSGQAKGPVEQLVLERLIQVGMNNPLYLVQRNELRKKLEKAQGDYLALYGNDRTAFAGQNQGILSFHRKILRSSQCLRNLAADFNSDIAMRDMRDLSGSSDPYKMSAQDDDRQRPSLRSSAKNPGWLWELSAQKASNNPNLAMYLMFVCGHDDTHNMIDFEKEKFLTPRMEEILLKKLKTSLKPFEANPKIYKAMYDAMKINFLGMDFRGKKVMTCPKTPMMPGSLGKKTLLSPEVIKQITAAQKPELNTAIASQKLPAKYYHTLTGAMAGCLFRQHGLNADIAKAVHLTAVEIYRNSRVCQRVKQRYEIYKGLSKLAKSKDPHKVEEFLVKGMKAFKEKNGNCSLLQGDEQALCKYLDNDQMYYFKDVGNDRNLSFPKLKSKLQSFGERMRTAILYTNNFKSNHGTTDSCSKENTLFKKTLSNVSKGAPANCGELSDKDCKVAQDDLKSYEADFIRDRKQHQLGVDFGSNKCKETSHPQALDSMCKAATTTNDTQSQPVDQ